MAEGDGTAAGGWEVDRLDPADRDGAVASLARAFWPDPLFGFFARDAVHEHRMLPTFFGVAFDDAARHGEVWVARRDGHVGASASWLAPGGYPRGPRREAGIYRGTAQALVNGRNRLLGMRLMGEVDRRHPKEPHWYLALLGSDPRWRGRGAAGAALRPVLDRCDTDGVPAYLETQKEENLAFYGRFGFTLREKVQIEGAPPVWLLWREPTPG